MQVSSALSVRHHFNSEFEKDFSVQLRLIDTNQEEEEEEEEVDGVESVKNEIKEPTQRIVQVEDEEEEEEEFSFVCLNPDGSPVSADDIFQNGQIRPFFPLFNRDLLYSDDDEGGHPRNSSSSSRSLRPPLRNLFVEDGNDVSSSTEPEGPYCTWTGKAVEASPQVCKKSNSTGSSKLRRFRELVLRSNSDGKDAFVFLHNHRHNNDRHSNDSAKTNNKTEKIEKVVEHKEKKRGEKSSASAHEKLYMRNKAAKEEHKRKSYLPYRVGFFAQTNGFSRNVHPY